MKLLTKLTGSWKQALAYWYKAPAEWTLPGWLSVRRVFVKVNGQWARTYIRNSFVVYALGLLQKQVPNAWCGVTMNARNVTGPHRSYVLAQFTKDGELQSFEGYDVFRDANSGVTGETVRMANALNAMANGQIFVVYSFDEPMAGHLHPLLIQAIERVGGVPGIYSQPMGYRGAYMLVGKVGFPNYFEKYVGAPSAGGAADGDPLAYITKRFTIINNTVLLMNDNWQWGAAVARDVHVAYALGGNQTVYPKTNAGLWVTDTVHKEKKEISAQRSYTLITFNADNAVNFAYAYDVHIDQVNGNLNNTNDLIAELNRMQVGQVFILLSCDEPSYGHLHQPLVDAVVRVGGTNAIFGQPMAYNGAYVLIGKVGEAASFEKAVGAGDATSAIRMCFFVESNIIHLVR